MFKILSIVAMCVAVASAASVQQSCVSINTASDIISPWGVVDPIVESGGVGTPIQLRVSGCEGSCQFTVETRYYVEQDFISSSAASQLAIRQSISIAGLTVSVWQETFPNSSVQPGVLSTAKYSFLPTGIFRGRSIELKGEILNLDTQLVESYISFDADVEQF